MANWTSEQNPFGQNRTPALLGTSSVDGQTIVPVAADPATGRLLVSSSGGGGGGTQYQELATTTPATGTLALARYQTSLPTLTNGQMNEPMLDNSSRLLVSVATNTTVVGTGTFAVQASQTGTWTVGTISAAINVGQQTVNTSAVQVSASSTVPTNGILIRALSTNAASIFVGGSGVTTSNGFELVAGETTSFTCNLNTIYIISATSTTDKICWNVE